MRILISLILLSLVCQAKQDVFTDLGDFIGGFISGLHIPKLAPAIPSCLLAATDVAHAVTDVIHAAHEHQDFYNFMNNMTLGLKTVSPCARKCAYMPEDIWYHLEEDYFKKFDYSWEKYRHAVFLNSLYRMDEVATNILGMGSAFKIHDIFLVGYLGGDILNFIFNVTTPNPIPLPDPVLDPVLEPIVESKFSALQTNWTEEHFRFRENINYAMTVLKYSKWVNETTVRNLNSSILDIEMKAYLSYCEFNKTVPNNKEGVLDLIDMTLYANTLFNGVYFTVVQLPQNILKNTVFGYWHYLWLHLLEHSGGILYNSLKLWSATSRHQYVNICRRATILLRKILYVDDDLLDEIYNRLPPPDLSQTGYD